MPTRFPTEAANADFIGEDSEQSCRSEGQDMASPDTTRSDPRGAADGALVQPQRSHRGPARDRRTPRAEVMPGKELNKDPKES